MVHQDDRGRYVYAIIKVAHRGDVLTDFTSQQNVTLVLSHLTLIDNDSHIVLRVAPLKREITSRFLDSCSTYSDVKYVELLNTPASHTTILMRKRSYGVQRAISRVGGIRVGSVIVKHGFKYFPVFVPRGSMPKLIEYVRRYSPSEVDVRLLGPYAKRKETLPTTVPTEYELQVLRMAYERGYFEWPKRVRLEELASELGVSKATLSEHLRKALKKILQSVLDHSYMLGYGSLCLASLHGCLASALG